MNCVPEALAYLIRGNEHEDWEFKRLLTGKFKDDGKGWTDLQMVSVASMYGVYLTPFVEEVDPISFLQHYYTTDGILVGNTSKGEPHAIAKRNREWQLGSKPVSSCIFYAHHREYVTCCPSWKSFCEAMGKTSR
jgi:hypothetical protein